MDLTETEITYIDVIKTYIFHSPKFPERLVRIKKLCNNLSINYEIFYATTTQHDHQTNISTDLISLLNLAISNEIYPFLILEDDADLIDSIPLKIYIPENIDILYFGSNTRSAPPVIKNRLKLKDYNNHYYQIFNSQSSHALIIPNLQSCLFLIDAYKIALNTNQYTDVVLANLSENKVFLTPKDGPYFYQNDGKNESITRFKWNNIIQYFL